MTGNGERFWSNLDIFWSIRNINCKKNIDKEKMCIQAGLNWGLASNLLCNCLIRIFPFVIFPDSIPSREGSHFESTKNYSMLEFL